MISPVKLIREWQRLDRVRNTLRAKYPEYHEFSTQLDDVRNRIFWWYIGVCLVIAISGLLVTVIA